MRLHILNDLHIEFGVFTPPATDADIVVLAGDIGVGVKGLHWAAERFTDHPLIYVPGNHEFYASRHNTDRRAQSRSARSYPRTAITIG